MYETYDYLLMYETYDYLLMYETYVYSMYETYAYSILVLSYFSGRKLAGRYNVVQQLKHQIKIQHNAPK